MAAAIRLRTDFDGDALGRLARQSEDRGQARRLLALATIYNGGSRGDAALIGGVTLQCIRDWVLRFNEFGPDGLLDRHGGGTPPRCRKLSGRAYGCTCPSASSTAFAAAAT